MSRLPRLLVGLGATGVALFATASPALAGTISSPTSPGNDANGNPLPYTMPVNQAGNPQAFTITATGFNPGNVTIEICDGVNPSATGWDPTIDCDPGSANAARQSTGPSTVETFPANDSNYAIRPFRGVSPFDTFNCLAPQDVKSKNPDGSVNPIGSTTANGNTIDTAQPSWTNCQLRVSSNTAATTTDQTFLPLAIQNTPPQTALPEVPLAAVLPAGAAVLFAAGYGLNRRRNKRAAA